MFKNIILFYDGGNMDYFNKSITQVAKEYSVDISSGLSAEQVQNNSKKHGLNQITKRKGQTFFSKIFSALSEPMLIILIFAFILAFGTKLGKYFKTGEVDFSECLGIFLAIVLSVSITLIMESSSAKAFAMLSRIYDNISVKVIRNGETIVISQKYVTIGDIVLLQAGDKIVADGRLVSSTDLSIDESALTGESEHTKKQANVVLKSQTPLAERVNCVYSGTFVVGGEGKMLVTNIGDSTEIGKIASTITEEEQSKSPLNQKLAKLGKSISLIGGITAVLVLILSVIRQYYTGALTFESFQDLLISCIILIVAAVPEGLPAIVAVSLALNMIKLARENALIKKMIATETSGAISVICSDKTGTLTKNEMTVTELCVNGKTIKPSQIQDQYLLDNFICNNTAEIVNKNKKKECVGSGTERALLLAVEKNINCSFKDYRNLYQVVYREPFSSESKKMITVIKKGGKFISLIKGAPEKVIENCVLSSFQKEQIYYEISQHQSKGERILCFGHKVVNDENSLFTFDGFCVLKDPVRKQVKSAIKATKSAGINVIMLTGDNIITATAIAKEIGLIDDESQAINASVIEKVDDEALKIILKRVKVIARSTPSSKLRIVKCLKELNEVVAVTGDGINDAPAIKHADVGISMGVSGSEITNETADIVLLDDSFATVVKAIEFGRNVYKNLQRFLFFQLSVNLSALLLITVCAILGVKEPFNTLQLLWVNIIMDGPPALTLGLQAVDKDLMIEPPVKREQSIINFKMLIRIVLSGMFMGGVVCLQYLYNFLGVPTAQNSGVVFTLFIVFQLFNAFNSTELGKQSILRKVKRNKIMIYTFLGVFIVHFVIVQFVYKLFAISPISFSSWIKCLLTGFSIIALSESYKMVYRFIKKINKNRLGA